MHAHSQAHERDRLGRSGWRHASQLHRPYRSHHSVGLHARRKCFRPEAENGGRDARAPPIQLHGSGLQCVRASAAFPRQPL